MDAEPGGAFEIAARLGGVAGFGIALTADAQLPEVRTNLHVACEADTAVREIETDGHGEAEWVSGINKRASLTRRLRL